MDVSSLDGASARLAVELRLEDITDALQNLELQTGQSASFQALRRSLQDQLDFIGAGNDSYEDSDTKVPSDPKIKPSASAVTISGDEDEGSHSEPEPDPEPEVVCCACSDLHPKKNTIELECKPYPHIYCHECIEQLFYVSVHKDSALFPPRCCQTAISFDICCTFIPVNLMKEVEAKQEECDAKNATFCSNATCGKLISSGNTVAGVGACTSCTHRTCTACKGTAHEGLCPQDEHTKLFMATAGKIMWQTCAGCKNMVELAVGCFHIVCRCGHQFCYMCGATWKTCRCPQFDEKHVLRPTPADTLEEAPIVCRHTWDAHVGTGCANCDDTDIKSAMRCSKCHVENCVRCIRNRN